MSVLNDKKMFSQLSGIGHDYLWRTLQVASKQGIVLLIFIMAAKLLSPTDFGLYSFLMAYISLLIIFSDFGVSTSLSRYVAEYKESKHLQFKLLLFNSFVLIFFLTLLVIVIFFIYAKINSSINTQYIPAIISLLLLAPLSAALDGVYRGLREFKLSSLISIVSGLISIPVSYFLILTYGIYGALLGQSVLYFLALAPMLYFQRHNFEIGIHRDTLKKIFFYSSHVGLATVGYFLFSRIDILILGQYGYLEEIATYEILNKLLSVGLVPVQILAQVVAPRFSTLNAAGDFLKINLLFKRFVVGLAVIAVIFFIVVPPALDLVVRLFFSEYYNQTFNQLLMLTVAIFSLNVYSAVISVGIITSTGYAKILSISNILLLIFNLITSIILFYVFGYIGVVYATLLSNIIGILITQLLYFRAIKLKAYEK